MHVKSILRPLCLAVVLLTAFHSGANAETEPRKSIELVTGGPAEVESGSFAGRDDATYAVKASKGEKLIIELKARNSSTYFNLTAPGAEEAMHIGSIQGERFDGVLPSDGEYLVMVYMMRNAARRNEKTDYTISFQLVPAAAKSGPATGP
ncbi:hypothetical protein [Iodidimonas sp. SYSU 1G8]|uniref:hypothetical protein n=1 Tax=Iodidimonas sp. SYSU 1G8 TaxID=3133967 RepID=UPI0031FE5E4A